MASTVAELMRRRLGGKKEEQDNYIYYDVFVSSANVSRDLFSGSVSTIAEMWMNGEQITPVSSMTFTTAGTYNMKILLNDPSTIPASAFNSGTYRDVVLPSCVTNIGTDAFRNYYNNTGKLTCLATTPPTLVGDPFHNRHAIAVYVPSESLTAYQTAWSMMTDIQAII